MGAQVRGPKGDCRVGMMSGFLQKLMARVFTNDSNLCLTVGSELGSLPTPTSGPQERLLGLSTLLTLLQQLI